MSRARAMAALCATGFVLAGSCTGTEVGNPVADVRVSLVARSSNGDVVLAPAQDAGSAPIAIDELWVSLGDIRFVLDEDCVAQRDLRGTIEGPFIADLANEPSALTQQLPHGRYCSVRVSLERAALIDSDAGAPVGLEGHSVYLRGHRHDGTPFLIRSRDKPDFVLNGRNTAFRVEDTQSALFLAFDAGAWLEGIDLTNAVPNADGEIVIEPGNEGALLTTFETNLRRSLALFKDRDADGVLDNDEAETPLAETP